MYKLFFIGTGKMATAIAGGVVKSKLMAGNEIGGFDVSEAACAAFARTTGCQASADDLAGGLANSEAIFLAVKPQMLETALASCKELLRDKLVISIVAGVSLEKLKMLTGASRIVRVMPNTPAMVGGGVAVYSAAPEAAVKDVELADKVFSAVGMAIALPEQYMDAVTAVSGSGPAYVFEFIQAMADGGVAEGLPRDIALKLAAQTVLGSAKMVLDSGEHPQQLKDNVTSPAGTTSRALEFMAAKGFSGIVMQSVRAAAQRSRELGGKK